MNPQIKKLIFDRRILKRKLTIETFVNDIMTSVPVANVRNRLQTHRPLLDLFGQLQDQIEFAVAGTAIEASQSAERDQFTDLYFSLISDLETYLANVTFDSK